MWGKEEGGKREGQRERKRDIKENDMDEINE